MPVTLEIIMDYSEQREQHIEDTRYLKWQDGMFVMLEDLECDYELALVENSLRDSVYLTKKRRFKREAREDCLGVYNRSAGLWRTEYVTLQLTRAQALYIATGETNN